MKPKRKAGPNAYNPIGRPRKFAGYTYRQIARDANVALSSVSNYINGELYSLTPKMRKNSVTYAKLYYYLNDHMAG